MSNPRKSYSLFDEDFDQRFAEGLVATSIEPQVEVETFSLFELQASCLSAAAAARVSAQTDLAQENQLQIRLACLEIGRLMRHLHVEAMEVAEAHSQAVAALLADVVRAALPRTCARQSAQELLGITEMLRDIFISEPEVFIHLHSIVADEICTELKTLQDIRPGCIHIIRNDMLQVCDVEISWKNGRAIRDMSVILLDIEQVIERFGLMSKQRDLTNGG